MASVLSSIVPQPLEKAPIHGRGPAGPANERETAVPDLVERTKAELGRRLGQMSGELGAWKGMAEANLDGQGIHRSQTLGVEVLMSVLVQRQKDLLQGLPGAPDAAFAKAYTELIDELASGHDVWRIFRSAMQQHLDKTLAAGLEAADLAAADCYLPVMKTARAWGATGDSLRPPPLVLLQSVTSPATVSRGEELGMLRFPLRRYRDTLLTVPLVLLPADQVGCLWLFCSLAHEVGHNADQDLKVQDELKGLVLAQAPVERRDQWWDWTGEILADAFGVLLGGPGFVSTLTSWLRIITPSDHFQAIDSRDPHPNPYVRTPLVCRMLETSGVPGWSALAQEVRAAAAAGGQPAWAADFVEDLQVIVPLFLDTKLAALKNHSLRELCGGVGAVPARLDVLAKYIGKGGPMPDAKTFGISYRAIPVAAQLGLLDAGDLLPATLDGVQQRAMAYVASIPRPDFLAGAGAVPAAGSQKQRDFLETLAKNVTFKKAS